MRKHSIFVLILCALAFLGYQSFVHSHNKGQNSQDEAYVSLLTESEKNEIATLVLTYLESVTSSVPMRDSIRVSDHLQLEVQRRSDGFISLESRIGAIFDAVVHDVDIFSATKLENDDILAEVYDAVYIDYHYPGNEDNMDYCAYGIWHTILLSKEEDSWKITQDSFDERLITGVASSDVIVAEEKSLFLDQTSLFTNGNQTRSVTYNYTAARINKAIQYAVTYCGLSTNQAGRIGYSSAGWSANNSNGTPSNYNPLYVSFHLYRGDCCNFVSQCLYAASHPTSSDWYFTNESNGNGGTIRKGSSAWRGVVNFKKHLSSSSFTGVSILAVPSNYSNVYTGNPVFWLESDGNDGNHIMICVGKNSGGVPVLCAHTTDLYRWPISAVYYNENGQSKNMKTLLITTSENHSHTYIYNSVSNTHHRRTCQYCETTAVVPHVLNNNARCIYCGYESVGSVGPVSE